MEIQGDILFQIFLQEFYGFNIAFKSEAHNGLYAGKAYIGDLTEILALGDIGDVHFHSLPSLHPIMNRRMRV